MKFHDDAAFWAHWARWPIAGAQEWPPVWPEWPSGTGENLTEEQQNLPADLSEALRRRTAERWRKLYNAIPPYIREQGIQLDEFHWVDPATGTVWELRAQTSGDPVVVQLSDADSRRYLASIGAAGGGTGGSASSGGGGGASTDPRYWAELDRQFQLDVQRLQADLMNMGLDAETARQQALASLIANRNATAADVANISANVARTVAEFAANPRDAVAELIYRNQAAGGTPFGDLMNEGFGAYGKALADKAASIFQPVAQDIQQARVYRDAIPPVEFFGPETRQQLGLPVTAAQSLAGGGTSAVVPAAAEPAPVNPLQALVDRLHAMSPEEQEAFRRWTSPEYRMLQEQAITNSEGGLNINIKHPAVVIDTVTGQIISTIAEPDPVTGEAQPEQLIVKPLPSVVKRRKENERAAKAAGMQVRPTGAGVPQMQDGGTITATPDDFMAQLRAYLGRLGGTGGGAGAFSSPLPSPRLLAGEVWNRLSDDPVAMDYALAGYSALGIDPRTIEATVRKFTPTSPMNNMPRVNWI